VEAERVHAGIGRCDSLEDLLASCDVVSLNCDLNADNHHLLNAATLSHIPKNKGVRPHAHTRPHTHHRTHHRSLTVAPAQLFLVNTARGGLIEETALLAAMADGRIGAAALDVLEEEPYTDGTSPVAHRVCCLSTQRRECRVVSCLVCDGAQVT
jgi:lactate dehydrogenase-like 2-hydroxyacid dehydrogenase